MISNNQLKKINEELKLEYEWRYKDLNNIKEIFNDNISLEKRQFNIYSLKKNYKSKFVLRTGILLIYAHWEGYFKFCIRTINKELDSITVDLNKLDISLLELLCKHKHTLKYKNNNLKFEDILIDTGSNLDWKRLEKIINIYNFDKKSFEKYKSDINNLVKIRNGIAHGENSYHFEEFKVINKYLNAVRDLMLLSRYSTIKFLKLKKYIKKENLK
jgi:hypothetical protein